jgi:hypothetical protein
MFMTYDQPGEKSTDTNQSDPVTPRTGPLPVKHMAAEFLVPDSEKNEPPVQRVETPREADFQKNRVSGHHEPPRQEGSALTSEKWKALIRTLRLHRRRLLSIPGVTAVDIGYKLDRKSRTFTSEVVLRVHVERRRPLVYFKDHPDELISISKDAADKDKEGLETCSYKDQYGIDDIDVMEAKYRASAPPQLPSPNVALEMPRRTSEVSRRRRLDPLVGGISIGSPSTPVGTLGALVWDKTDGTICILSNWHVLAGNPHVEAGSPCFQPGRFDRGSSSDVVARLKRWSFDNETDAAIAQLTGNRHYCAGEILDLYQQITGVDDPYLGMVVLKSGRSSGVTWGFVDGLYFSTVIEYGNGIVREFEDQIHIAPLPPPDDGTPSFPISDTGDSGSVWVTKRNGSGYRAVGLHFAGDLPRSSFGEYALANPMRTVKERLNFSFRPRFLEVRDEALMMEPAPEAGGPQRRSGTEPARFIDRGLDGSGGQPDPIEVPPTRPTRIT